MQEYEPLEIIGSGSFGVIRKVRRKSDGKILARKEIEYLKMSHREKQQLVAEVNILRELKHPNIVRYYERFVDREKSLIYIIMEYCQGGDLSSVIKRCKKQNKHIPENIIWDLLAQLTLALHTCHKGNGGIILHRDIKPENVLLDMSQNVKLGDFGLSKVLTNSEKDFANTFVGTPFYMSPELVGDGCYNTKSDIWSLGCLIFELCALDPPFQAKTQTGLADRIKIGNPPDIPNFYSDLLQNTIKHMLHVDSDKRPCTSELLEIDKIRLNLKNRELLLLESNLKKQQEEMKRTMEKLKIKEQELSFRENQIVLRENMIKNKRDTMHGIYTNKSIIGITHDVSVDFRSDTVTKPTKDMIDAMSNARVGDDVYREDYTVNLLQERMAKLTGHESALFCVSGTMANQLAIRTHLMQPPYSIICDKRAHIYAYEASGISFHTGAQVIPLHAQNHPNITCNDISKEIILDNDIHVAPTKLICLENTLNGEIFPIQEIKKISALAKDNNMRLHLDGARLWNASVETGISLDSYGMHFDSMSLCFSKGLGAPIGSVLVGNAKFIEKARHFRKLYGGGWRQSGILAAACLYSLDHILPILKRDHDLCKYISQELLNYGYKFTHRVDTNMIWIDLLNDEMEKISQEFRKCGILVSEIGDNGLRLVIHHQISEDAVNKLLKVMKNSRNIKNK